MKKIILLGLVLVFSIDAILALPPTKEDVPLAFQVLVSNVAKKSRIVGNKVSYILPDGKIITMKNNRVKSIDKFWNTVLAQNTIKGICDVTFGASYDKAKTVLEEKFGEPDSLSFSKDSILFRKKEYKGIRFDWMTFLFQTKGKESFFNGAIFGIDCKSKSDAIRIKREFHELLSERYANFLDLDNGNHFESCGGFAPVLTDKNLGFAIRIELVENKESDLIFDKTYAVHIIYGPFDFVKK